VFNIDLAGDGKLGYGFTSADELEEIEEVKGEVRKMLDAGYIRPHRYIEWISNVVLMERKDGRWRIAINDQDPSNATPKGE
jgi:subtilisin-like proprotein convertase family protein